MSDLLSGKDTGSGFRFWLPFSRHVLSVEPQSVHNGIGENIGFLLQHPITDVIKVEQIVQKVAIRGMLDTR